MSHHPLLSDQPRSPRFRALRTLSARGRGLAVLAGAVLTSLTSLAPLARAEDAAGATLEVAPARSVLRGALDRRRLVVFGDEDGRRVDLSRRARFRSLQPDVASVDEDGVVRPRASGVAVIEAEHEGRRGAATVEVIDGETIGPIDFERDVQPFLSRGGCDSGPCHGKQRGQNGFQLSLLGFDADFDHASIASDTLGRRIDPAFPERSLLLLKPSGALPHGGGVRLAPGTAEWTLLSRWIGAGAPRRAPRRFLLEGIEVAPAARALRPGEEQQILVTATYRCESDAALVETRDVTHLAAFLSSEAAVVGVDENGLLRAGPLPGEATIMARFQGHIATCAATIPLAEPVDPAVFARLPRRNFIDDLVWRKLATLGLEPSPRADDATFLRRAHIDIIGRLPTVDEARAWLADEREDRRERLIDALLERPEYADYQASKWVDLLRPNPYRVGIKAVLNYDAWIRRAFRDNLPWDEIVRGLLTARGSTFRNGAVTLFRDRRSPEELATMASQLFLGIRLECARCHHHPFEKWSQEDFYGFAAFFGRLGRKGTGLSPPISGSEEMVYASERGEVRHPRTGEVLPPRPLFGAVPESPEGAAPTDGTSDARNDLAAWMLDGDNPYPALVMANRVWADLMGRGLVDPVDDLRITNPPTNAPLLEALADSFRDGGYDLKRLIRTIATSEVYGLSALPGSRNAGDTRNHSRHYRRILRAEVLLDAFADITGIGERFAAMPPGARAVELWTHRIPSVFLDTFSRPDANQDPPCFRAEDSSVSQALHLMNSPDLDAKVRHDRGRAAALAASDRDAAAIVEELYLAVYSRRPRDAELETCRARIAAAGADRRQVVEDILWALLNSPEFFFEN